MNTGRTALILLAVSAALAVLVPSVREGIDIFFLSGILGHPDKLPSPATVEQVVQERPEDAMLALGRAEYLAGLRAANRRVSGDFEWGVQEDFRTRLARAMPSSVPSEQDVADAYELALVRADSDLVVMARQALWLLPPFPEDVYLLSDPSEPPPEPNR